MPRSIQQLPRRSERRGQAGDPNQPAVPNLGQGGSYDPCFPWQRGEIPQSGLGSYTTWSKRDLNTPVCNMHIQHPINQALTSIEGSQSHCDIKINELARGEDAVISGWDEFPVSPWQSPGFFLSKDENRSPCPAVLPWQGWNPLAAELLQGIMTGWLWGEKRRWGKKRQKLLELN